MNDFFDLDAPLFRFLTRVADMVILSLLWLIGSLPLFTLGISSTALYYAVNKSLIENRGTVSEEFFRAYRRSFRQATLSFLALAVPGSILLADCFTRSISALIRNVGISSSAARVSACHSSHEGFPFLSR